MKTTAREVGRKQGRQRDGYTKQMRRELLREAGLERTSETAEEFNQGHAEGCAERIEAEAPAKAAEELRLDKLRRLNDQVCEAVHRSRPRHRDEEKWETAERLRREQLGLEEAPPEVLAEIDRLNAEINELNAEQERGA